MEATPNETKANKIKKRLALKGEGGATTEVPALTNGKGLDEVGWRRDGQKRGEDSIMKRLGEDSSQKNFSVGQGGKTPIHRYCDGGRGTTRFL